MVRSRLGLRQKVWSAEVMGLRPIRTRIRPLSDFLATESAGGIALVAAVFVALLWANSPWSESYERMWSEVLEVRLGSQSLTMDLRHWLNDGLMAIFFLVAGLEIKREIVEGELRDGRHRALPVVAALGGMLTPALLYVSFNSQGPWVQGWGIPMATDIALVVGVMSLAGNRVDPRLKLFLLALAIVDDIGAILVIGLFYGGQGDRRWLLIGGLVVLVALSLRRRAVQLLSVYVILGIGLWLSLHQAGIHPTISGVIMGLLAPTKPYLPPELIDETELLAIGSVESVVDTRRLARSTVSVVEWLEHRLHPWTSFWHHPSVCLCQRRHLNVGGVTSRRRNLAGCLGSHDGPDGREAHRYPPVQCDRGQGWGGEPSQRGQLDEHRRSWTPGRDGLHRVSAHC